MSSTKQGYQESTLRFWIVVLQNEAMARQGSLLHSAWRSCTAIGEEEYRRQMGDLKHQCMLSTTKSNDRISMMFSIIRQSCSLCENVKVCKEDVLFAAQLHESINAYDSNLHEMRIFTRAHASRTSIVPFLQVISRIGNVVLGQRLESCVKRTREQSSPDPRKPRGTRVATKESLP